MVKTGILIALTLITTSQAPQPTQSSSELKRRRDQVRMLEGVLTGAVRLGAENLSRQMQSADPTVLMTTGTARARGFILEGYGVFFDVDIPALRQSAVWAFQTMNRDLHMGNALDSLRALVRSVQDPASRTNLEQALKRVELQVGPVSAQQREPAPSQRAMLPGMVSGAVASEPPDDPDAAYTEAVKAALIDAMLDYSAPVDLTADEWLTVAARASEEPVLPGEIYDARTIVIRVKGSDIATYANDRDRAKRDEIRKRVAAEVRVF